MHTRVKLLLLLLSVLIISVPLTLAQEETPSLIDQFAMTATAIIEARTGTPAPEEATVEVTIEPTEEVTAEATVEPTVEPTVTPAPAVVEPTEEVTPEPTPVVVEPEAEESPVQGLPLLWLLVGAVAVLLIGTVVLIRENPRPMDEDE